MSQQVYVISCQRQILWMSSQTGVWSEVNHAGELQATGSSAAVVSCRLHKVPQLASGGQQREHPILQKAEETSGCFPCHAHDTGHLNYKNPRKCSFTICQPISSDWVHWLSDKGYDHCGHFTISFTWWDVRTTGSWGRVKPHIGLSDRLMGDVLNSVTQNVQIDKV